MEINEAGGDDQAAGVEGLVGTAADLIGRRDFRNATFAQEYIHGRVELRGRVDDAAAFNQQ